jgi:hypothetical protein
MGHHNHEVDMNERFVFPAKLKNIAFGLMGIGLLAFLVGAFMNNNGTRTLAVMLQNGLFFMFICLISTFFIAIHYLGNGGWHILFKRIPEAISQTVPLIAVFVFGVITYIILGKRNDIYMWLDIPAIKNAETRELLEGKTGYLNVPFYMIRLVAYLAVWSFGVIQYRKFSLREDVAPAGSLKNHVASRYFSGFFLVFFAVTVSTSSWDWLMGIDTKWYSTMFGWYAFASALVSGISLMMLVIQYLRNNGYLKSVTDEHIHDLGKFMFAFSILWTYLWYSQFMLIWYSNNPEETVYFRQRWDHYKVLFYLNLLLNFVTPIFALMKNTSKRNKNLLIFMAALIIIGHWVDYYQMIMPGTIGNNWNIGMQEIGLPLFFVGLIIWRTFSTLEKAPLIPQNHPYIQESIHHHV